METETETENATEDLKCALVNLGIMTTLVVFNAWAFSILWNWFVAPQFGAPILTTPYALGLLIMIKTLIMKQPSEKRDMPELSLKALHEHYKTPVHNISLTLAVGWVVLQFT